MTETFNLHTMSDAFDRKEHLLYMKNSSKQTFRELIYFDRNKTRSNLPFQMILYANLWFFPIWLLAAAINFDAKYDKLTNVYKAIASTTLLAYSILECLKLYLGFIGNLAGKIPELTSCWLICLLIQFPMEIFLIFDQKILLYRSEVLLNVFMIFLLLLEIIMGVIALKNLAGQRAKTFYLTKLYNIHNEY